MGRVHVMFAVVVMLAAVVVQAGAAPAASVSVDLAVHSTEGATANWAQEEIRVGADRGERLTVSAAVTSDAVVVRSAGPLTLVPAVAAAARCTAVDAATVTCVPARDTDPDVLALLGGSGAFSKPARTVLSLAGGDGDDVLSADVGSSAVEVQMAGGGGQDRLSHRGPANAERAVLSGGDGIDHLVGGPGAETLNGDAGGDVVSGGAGADRLGGGAGADRLLAGPGADELAGDGTYEDETGATSGPTAGDTLDGGDGVDLAVFGRGARRASVDLAAGRGGVDGERDRLVSVEGASASAPVVELAGDGRANVLATQVLRATRRIALRGRGGADSLQVWSVGSPRGRVTALLDGGPGADACGVQFPPPRLRLDRDACERRWPPA